MRECIDQHHKASGAGRCTQKTAKRKYLSAVLLLRNAYHSRRIFLALFPLHSSHDNNLTGAHCLVWGITNQ